MDQRVAQSECNEAIEAVMTQVERVSLLEPLSPEGGRGHLASDSGVEAAADPAEPALPSDHGSSIPRTEHPLSPVEPQDSARLEDVVESYRVFLGRRPESSEVVQANIGVSVASLPKQFLRESEFLNEVFRPVIAGTGWAEGRFAEAIDLETVEWLHHRILRGIRHPQLFSHPTWPLIHLALFEDGQLLREHGTAAMLEELPRYLKGLESAEASRARQLGLESPELVGWTRKTVGLHKLQASEYRIRGDGARARSDWARAADAYEAHLRMFPSDSVTWYYLADVLREEGEFEEVERTRGRAEDACGGVADLLLNLGGLYRTMGRFSEALELYARSSDADPLALAGRATVEAELLLGRLVWKREPQSGEQTGLPKDLGELVGLVEAAETRSESLFGDYFRSFAGR